MTATRPQGKKRVRAFYGLPPWDGKGAARGLPIGNVTSQWWGNCYLNGLDHFVKRQLKVPGYVRYMDDFVCFGHDPRAMTAWRAAIAEWLASRRKLAVHPGKGLVKSCRLSHRFLGYRVTRAGWDLGRVGWRRFHGRLPGFAAGSTAKTRRRLHAWRGALML